jgi:hypothetical protein
MLMRIPIFMTKSLQKRAWNQTSLIQNKKLITRLPITFMLGVLFFYSCQKDPSPIGEDLIENRLTIQHSDDTDIYATTDTTTKINTEGVPDGLVGYYEDPVFGKMKCGFVCEFNMTTDGVVFDYNTDPVANSFTLTLAFKEFFSEFGDASSSNKVVFTVHELLDAFPDAIYSNYSPTFDPTPLTTITLTRDMLDTVVVEDENIYTFDVTLPTTYAQKILDLDTILDNDSFHESCRGLYFNPDTINSNAVGKFGIILSDFETFLHLEYTDTASQEYDFVIDDDCTRANLFDKKQDSTFIDTIGTAEKFYLQSGGGFYSIIKIPGLDTWKEMGDLIINKATLTVYVDSSSQTDIFGPPSQISAYHYGSEDLSIPLSYYHYDNYGLAINVEVDGSYNSTEKYYQFNIARYIQMVVDGDLDNNGIFIIPEQNPYSVSRVILNNKTNSENSIKLDINYHKID